MSEPERLTHIDAGGQARMVDVGGKPESDRFATARAVVEMSEQTARLVRDGSGPKGEVASTARIAGIQAAKRAAELVPLAHPIPLDFVGVDVEAAPDRGEVVIEAEARTRAATGVEIEAMTACAVAALTVYDMVKGTERGVRIGAIELLSKSGGRTDWQRD